jgi:hypothetical protein
MNNDINVGDFFKRLDDSDGFFVTATVLDKSKEVGNLHHFTFKKEFPVDDIIPSLDHAVRSLGIVSPEPPSIIVPEEEHEEKKLKIAIISHFNKAPEYYSPARAVRNQIKILKENGHEVVFFVQEGSTIDWDCDVKRIIPSFKRERGVVNEEAKSKFIDILRQELTDNFDVAITHDLYIEDCITYREAIRECGVNLPWFHWARSGVGKPIDFSMPNAKYVYMNIADAGMFANNINVPVDSVRVVFNEKDPSFMFGWDKTTKMISNKLDLPNKDIVQIYPMCTTRMDAKGINSVFAVFGALKRLGQKVGLVICNANGHKRQEEIDAKIMLAKEYGLDDNDLVFTSTLANEEHPIHKDLPNTVVSQLFAISNLFIFPTVAEVCSNVLLEASMTKNLLVLNKDLPSLFDFADNGSVLSYPFTSLQSIHYSGRDKESITNLAKQIVGQIKSNKADLQMRRVWRKHNNKAIYKQLMNVLYERN